MRKIITFFYLVSILLACSTSSDDQEVDVSEGQTNWTKYSYFENPVNEFASFSSIGIYDITFQGENIFIGGFYMDQEPVSSVWKSTDQGLTWSHTSFGCGAGNEIIALEAPSENTIYALQTCLSSGVLYKSIDGGENWTLKSGIYLLDPIGPSDIMHFFNDTDGIVGFLRTTDGGENWTEIEDLKPYSFTEDFRSLSFVNDQLGYCNTENTLFFTENGGENWSMVHEDLQGSFRNIYFINRDTGFLMTETQLLKTSDGGQTWNIVLAQAISDISFNTDQVGFAAGAGGVYKTTDNGETWTLNYFSNFIKMFDRPGSSATLVNGFNAVEFQGLELGVVGGYQDINGNPPNDKGYIARTLTAGE